MKDSTNKPTIPQDVGDPPAATPAKVRKGKHILSATYDARPVLAYRVTMRDGTTFTFESATGSNPPTFRVDNPDRSTESISRIESSRDGREFSTVFERKVKKPKPLSRADRWAIAAGEAKTALEELKSVQDEFEAWKENIEERFSGTATYEKLDTICGIDVQSALDAVEEAESADVPVGFGRD